MQKLWNYHHRWRPCPPQRYPVHLPSWGRLEYSLTLEARQAAEDFAIRLKARDMATYNTSSNKKKIKL